MSEVMKSLNEYFQMKEETDIFLELRIKIQNIAIF